MGTYEPPLSKEGEGLDPMNPGQLAPGVRGYAVEANGKVYIPLIEAEKPGSGDVAKFLDSLSARCVCGQRMLGSTAEDAHRSRMARGGGANRMRTG